MRELKMRIDQWDQALALLPDALFLELIRNYIGKVETPFHKPIVNKTIGNIV
ncbi:MAG: hypothetical protein ACOXZ4_01255 [Sphaerochaetaceae bacterium]